jgi:hypothetical protein
VAGVVAVWALNDAGANSAVPANSNASDVERRASPLVERDEPGTICRLSTSLIAILSQS